jgi:tetratricopeptide (TPR) repeat protein
VTKFLFFLLFTTLAIGSQPHWISEGIELTINNRFDEAMQVFLKACEENPDDHRSYFYLAATLDSKMTHYENDVEAKAFNDAIDTVLRLVKAKMSEASVEDAELVFYLGSAYGYRAYFLGRRGSWYSALSNGKKATSLLQQAVALDSTLYDAYLGIGTYKYWLYSKLKFITWLPFVPDEREKGVQMIRKPIKRNARSKYMAMHQLIYILTDYKRENEMVVYADTLVKQYPASQFMLWAAAHAYSKNQNHTRAIAVFESLTRLLEDDPNPNPSHVLKCSHKLAEQYLLQLQFDACFAECTRILQISKTLRHRPKDEKIIEEIYKLKDLSKKEIIAANDSLQ